MARRKSLETSGPKLLLDTPVWFAAELNLVLPPRYRYRRYQIIEIRTGDQPRRFMRDMGPVELFDTPEFRFPVQGEHTLAEVLEICAAYREGNRYWQAEMAALAKESTLIADAIERAEINQAIKQNRSQFGPGGFVQRNAYPSSEKDVREFLQKHGIEIAIR